MHSAQQYPLEPAQDTLARLKECYGDTRVLVEPEDDEVFIDIDSNEALERLDLGLTILRGNGIDLGVVIDAPSRSEGHRHVVLRADHPLTPFERIVLQACLGSDLKRELLAILRVWNGISPVTVFFMEEATVG